ncbi:MAG TPA: hypothetical protein VGP07_05870 [Polyangia bacterium]
MAVSSARATPDERDEALPPARARSIADRLSAEMSRDILLELYELSTGQRIEPAIVRADEPLTREVARAATEGRLLFLEGWNDDRGSQKGESPIARSETTEDKLVREAMGERREIPFEGRRYRLLPAARFKTARLSNFRVVSGAEARGVIERMQQRAARTPRAQDLWTAVAQNLLDGKGGKGLLLLRDRPSGEHERRAADEPSMTPSQLKAQIAPTDWIEIKVVYDDDGSPFDGACSLVLPDGREVSATPDEDGIARFEGLQPGDCLLSFPDLDASSVQPG